MTNKDYDLNLWERNSVRIPAVQGESNSRTINFHLKEEVSVQDALGNLAIRQKPVDLTGCNVRLYFLKPDSTKVFSDGTVSDATNGITTFTLPYQATTADGLSEGQILISKPDGTTLKAIGIELQTNPSDLDGTIESTNDFSVLVTALNKIEGAQQQATQAVADAQAAVVTANQASSTANAAATEANTATTNANNAATAAKNLPYIGLDGYWYTYDFEIGAYKKTTSAANGFATFEVNPSGELVMHTADGYSGANFALNDNGELEVII